MMSRNIFRFNFQQKKTLKHYLRKGPCALFILIITTDTDKRIADPKSKQMFFGLRPNGLVES